MEVIDNSNIFSVPAADEWRFDTHSTKEDVW